MKYLFLPLLPIIIGLSTLPARAEKVEWGYATEPLKIPVLPSAATKPLETPALPSTATPAPSSSKAMAAFANLDYDEAISALKQDIKANPHDVALKLQMFTVLKVAGNTIAVTRPKDALVYLFQAAEMNPSDYFVRGRIGDAYCKMGKIRLCYENHMLSIKLNPSKGNGFTHLGLAFLQVDPKVSAKAFDAAVKAYDRVGDHRNAAFILDTKKQMGL
jgi:tetratricopeptide (TPR) repeat protein